MANFEAVDSMFSIGEGITSIFMYGGGLIVIIVALYFFGFLDRFLGKYTTVTLCYEKRQGKLMLIDIDQSGPFNQRGETIYKLKKRKIQINPPALNYIQRDSTGRNILFLYFPDRNEAYPFIPQMLNYEDLLIELEAEYAREHNDTIPETKAEFLEALELLDKKQTMTFKPVVDDSSLNLLIAELQKNKERYQSKWETLLAKYGAWMAVIICAFITLVGYYMITGALRDLDIGVTVDVAGLMQGGAETPPESPLELP